MKSVVDLELGFSDAENYKKRENKELFNKIFVRTEELDNLCKSNCYFLVGEKGTGKTAYAVYLSNNKFKETNAALRYLRETEYEKFVALKKKEKLVLSDYTTIWRVIIYLLISQQICDSAEGSGIMRRFGKFKKVREAVDEFYDKAFSPEILYALHFVDNSKVAAELIAKHLRVESSVGAEVSTTERRFQTNLLYIQKHFEDALSEIKLNENFMLFIDGIDIRPAHIHFEDYLQCVKGLANAVWSTNSDFFPNIKDSKGRMRVVLLVRPDIFDSLGLQNQNTKIRDNAVVLDWRTTYPEYRRSKLFRIADKLLSAQQEADSKEGVTWDYYFPYQVENVDQSRRPQDAFVSFLRFSYFRPRDIVTLMKILQHKFKSRTAAPAEVFNVTDFDDPSVRREYSDYLLGEVKDHLAFYYTSLDYEMFLKFFEYLDGKYKFSYVEFVNAYNQWQDYLHQKKISKLNFAKSNADFLQFLYDLNVICYIEKTSDEKYIRWCFRERSQANISPKVKLGLNYEIHYGLGKALNVGRPFVR